MKKLFPKPVTTPVAAPVVVADKTQITCCK